MTSTAAKKVENTDTKSATAKKSDDPAFEAPKATKVEDAAQAKPADIVPADVPLDETKKPNPISAPVQSEMDAARNESGRLGLDKIVENTEIAGSLKIAAADQGRMEALQKDFIRRTDDNVPSYEEHHERALESVARSHVQQNGGQGAAIAAQMASQEAYPDKPKTVVDSRPRIRHISEFDKAGVDYRGKPEDIAELG